MYIVSGTSYSKTKAFYTFEQGFHTCLKWGQGPGEFEKISFEPSKLG